MFESQLNLMCNKPVGNGAAPVTVTVTIAVTVECDFTLRILVFRYMPHVWCTIGLTRCFPPKHRPSQATAAEFLANIWEIWWKFVWRSQHPSYIYLFVIGLPVVVPKCVQTITYTFLYWIICQCITLWYTLARFCGGPTFDNNVLVAKLLAKSMLITGVLLFFFWVSVQG